jgi:hypothetical protein
MATKKSFQVIKSELVQKRLKSRYNKFQRLMAKWLRVEPADFHEYLIRIKYKSGNTTLKADDVVINRHGTLFVVIDTAPTDKLALIVTVQPQKEKPLMYGTFNVQIRK